MLGLDAGDLPRFLALMTDAEAVRAVPPEAILAAVAPQGTPGTALEAGQTALFAILDIERLADGRVGAFAVVDTPFDPLPVEINYQIAAETPDGWRLDGFICFSEVGQLC